MNDLVRDLAPPAPSPDYDAALARLQDPSTGVRIAHIDAGVAPHLTFGDADALPPNILVDEGRNFFDPKPEDHRPIASLKLSGRVTFSKLEFPDHGVKTLSAILGVTDHLKGVAPGAPIVPYRIANGPLFIRSSGAGPFMQESETERLGDAIEHLMSLDPVPRVVSISMGNPATSGLWDILRILAGGESGLARRTKRLIRKAYERGIIVVCAAGQVIDTVVLPARMPETIAVGGFDRQGGKLDHYPPNGYMIPALVDVWAQAERINRATYDLNRPSRPQIFAEDEAAKGDPSGTSYACPQVAAAAALWCALHREALDRADYLEQPWRAVEAFRFALRESAREERATLAGPDREQVWIKSLDIPRLLALPPVVPADGMRVG
ncbi:MAG: S8/S53 family peptidase [Pseudomonadota bacterium]